MQHARNGNVGQRRALRHKERAGRQGVIQRLQLALQALQRIRFSGGALLGGELEFVQLRQHQDDGAQVALAQLQPLPQATTRNGIARGQYAPPPGMPLHVTIEPPLQRAPRTCDTSTWSMYSSPNRRESEYRPPM